MKKAIGARAGRECASPPARGRGLKIGVAMAFVKYMGRPLRGGVD